ncbi:hypothetical protein R6Q57_005163 [Mikania cordata]
MVKPFLVTNGLFGYVDGTNLCPSSMIVFTTSSSKEAAAIATEIPNPSHAAWASNDAHIRMLLMSTISEASFKHVQGETSRDLWLSLKRSSSLVSSSEKKDSLSVEALSECVPHSLQLWSSIIVDKEEHRLWCVVLPTSTMLETILSSIFAICSFSKEERGDPQ